jgi:hypothetical protein
MCLEFPQFGYDVLSEFFLILLWIGCFLTDGVARVLDEKLKREKQEKMHPSHGTPGSSRKRARGI